MKVVFEKLEDALKIPSSVYTIRTETLKVEETLVEWISRKNGMLLNDPRYDNVEGVILYDVETYFDSPYKDKVHSGLVVKYKFLRK
jgi:hypothetical protein